MVQAIKNFFVSSRRRRRRTIIIMTQQIKGFWPAKLKMLVWSLWTD